VREQINEKAFHTCSQIVHFVFFERGSPGVAQAGLRFVILLPQPPQYCDYRCAPPHTADCKLVVLSSNTVQLSYRLSAVPIKIATVFFFFFRNGQCSHKFIWKFKGHRVVNISFDRKRVGGRLSPDQTAFYKARPVVWCWYKNEIERVKTLMYLGSVGLGQRCQDQWGKQRSFEQILLNNRYVQKKEDPSLILRKNQRCKYKSENDKPLRRSRYAFCWP
jgi:hypothetical protein